MSLPHTTGSTAARPPGAILCTIGLVADTHIPDRARQLHPRLVPLLKEARVSYILHAGDICTRQVLDDLRAIAPVTAVRGNRDLLAGQLPMSAVLEAGGVRVKLVHGHFGLFPYLWDKVHFLRSGYNFWRYLPRLVREMQDADVLVFGHTHFPEVISLNGKLLVNPGSASFGPKRRLSPSFGLLRIDVEGRASVEVVSLTGWKIRKREWMPV